MFAAISIAQLAAAFSTACPQEAEKNSYSDTFSLLYGMWQLDAVISRKNLKDVTNEK